MGGEAVIDAAGENLCRRDPERGFVIESQGLPNLIHELVHALFLGRLEDDHGFDYGLIPLDLAKPEHRRHLWEELACCHLSAIHCEPYAQPGFRQAWFIEQFEIQGVFHGLEHDLARFRVHVDAALGRVGWAEELDATVQEADRLLRAKLAEVGCDPGVLVTSLPSFMQAWREYRSTWSV